VNLFSGVVSAQLLVFGILTLAIFVLCVWALIDCATRAARAFPAAGKRTKMFWLLITGAATVVGFLALPLGGSSAGIFQFFALIGAVVVIVYLVDVRPAVAPYSRRGGGGGRRRPGPPTRGGW